MKQEERLEKVVTKIIEEDLADADTITASMVADLACEELKQYGLRVPIDTLKNVASSVLKKLFEPDVDAETARRHAEALAAWAKAKG